MTAFPAITELVPHQAPMLALEALVEWEPGRAVARMTVRDDLPFVQDGRVDAVAALEYMAQAVAACLGMESWTAGGGVRVGMVIACRRMTLRRACLEVGEALVVEARCVRGADHVSHYDTETRDANGAVVATATLTLVHGEQPPAAAGG